MKKTVLYVSVAVLLMANLLAAVLDRANIPFDMEVNACYLVEATDEWLYFQVPTPLIDPLGGQLVVEYEIQTRYAKLVAVEGWPFYLLRSEKVKPLNY